MSSDFDRDTEAKSGRKRRKKSEGSFLGGLRASFFTGIIVATPIAVTAALVYGFITFVDSRVKPLLPDRYNPETWLKEYLGTEADLAIPGLGLLVAVIFLILLGAFARNFLGRSLINLGERIVNRLPLVRSIYSALKQLVDTIAAQREQSFQEVALVEYPRKGLWAVGFVTASAKGHVAEHLSESYVGVFIPTTPNPTSGFLLFAPRDDIHVLDMTVEEGAKLIISAGLVTPEVEAKLKTKTGEAPPTSTPPSTPPSSLPPPLPGPDDSTPSGGGSPGA